VRQGHSDVVVVGGGPAGIAAATCAAEAGARVTLVDAGFHPGGQIWRHANPQDLPRVARGWMDRCRRAGVEWIPQAFVVDGSLQDGLTVVRATQTMVLHAERIILATGARELFLPFPGWTLANAMGAGGAQSLLKGGLDVRGKRVIVAGSGPLLLPVAAAIVRAGAYLSTVAEQTSTRRLAGFALSLLAQPSKLALGARYRAAIPLRAYRPGVWVARAEGNQRVQSVTLTDGRRRWTEPCDLLCCGFGLVPNIELARVMGCDIDEDKVRVDTLQQTTVNGILSAGESTGVAGDAAAIVEGQIAGLVAGNRSGDPRLRNLERARDKGRQFARALSNTFNPRAELRSLADGDTVICRCEDVRLGDLDPTWTGRQAKLYSRAGMGPCQGAVCGPSLKYLMGWPVGSVRPPLHSPALGAWAAGSENADASSHDRQ
jgi:D-hydroxyproline dehydrogenase subunit alpha